MKYSPLKYQSRGRYLQVLVPLRGVTEEDLRFYDGADTFQLVLEGLALLAAVATVDYKAWGYLLEKHCAVPLGQEGDELYEDEIPVRFLLILDRRAARRGWNQQPNSFRTEETLIFDKEYDNPRSDIQIPVQVQFVDGFSDVTALTEIVKAETLLEEEKQTRMIQLAQTEPLQCSFVLEPTLADCTRGGIHPDLCEALGAIVQGNIFLSILEFLPCMDELRNEEFGHLMRLLLNSVCHPSLARVSSPYRFGRVELSCLEWLPNRGPEMVLSALAQTRTTNHLEFSLIEDEWEVTGMWWKWIAYACFSKRARTCLAVENLDLNWITEMQPSDMELFAAVVAAENPEEVLFESPPGVIEAREATLQSGCRFEWQISTEDDAHPRTLTFEEPVPFVWTFSDDGESDWLNAVVPGSNAKGVRSLELFFVDSADRTGLPRFLSAIAPTLRSLTIDKEYEQVDVSMVLQCCPLLEELVLCDELVDLRLNFSEFHATGQPLPTLTLDWDNLPGTLAAFSDPGSILARCLRKLRILLFSNDPNDERFSGRSGADVVALLELLKKNRTLQYLEGVTRPLNFQYEDEFRKFHLQPIAVQERPLSMECKTAFLSAFRSESSRRPKKAKSGEEPSPLPSPDSFVVSNIFAFAAEPVKRKVFFTKERRSGVRFDRRSL
ncbi:hypothetical protein V7S43_015295 [Phytophthora oleae]|uniref:Uncharacterized protein n=1 Tax=Phytophthora oleae TaxID=2107226 RepID=A0ABD3F2B0_9STRA